MSLHVSHQRANATNIVDPSYELDFAPIVKTECLTRIMCNLDRASNSKETILKMIQAGMNVARINASGKSYYPQEELIKNIRAAANEYSEKTGFECPLAIALDTNGPKIRTGTLTVGLRKKVRLQKGDEFRLTNNRDYIQSGNHEIVYVDFEDIVNFVKPGDRIYLEHGSIQLMILDVQVTVVVCKVESSGFLGSKASVNLPGITTDLLDITDKDKADFKFAVENNIDMVLISYTRDAETVKRVRYFLGEQGKNVSIIAKIESRIGLDNINEIIRVADGILIGRGDLSIELPLERISLGQKAIINRCNRAGKPVILSTEILNSMVSVLRPSLPEISDLANAVLDGVDCISLHNSTAYGEFPLETVETAVRICCEAESATWHQRMFQELSGPLHDLDAANSIGIAAVEATTKSNASLVITITTSGRTAFMVAKYRPRVPIIAVSRFPSAARRAQLHRGIWPLVYYGKPLPDWIRDVDNRVAFSMKYAYQKKFVRAGDAVVVVTGWKEGVGYTNTLRVIYACQSAVDMTSGDHREIE